MKRYIYLLLFISALFFTFNGAYAQEEREDDASTWKYFRIDARAQDDSVFVKIQEEMGVTPLFESYPLYVNILDPNPANHYIVIGDEASQDKTQVAWSTITPGVQKVLLAYRGANKVWLNKKKLNYGSVFLDAFKNIKFKEFIAPPGRYREIKSTTAYINPYLQIFGGEPLGIPLKQSFGFSFFSGTPYSAPLECDMVGANFHLLGLSVGISTRLKELVRVRAAGHEEEGSFGMQNYNNIFTPKLAMQVSYVIPLGNFLEISYYHVLDSGDYDPPVQVINKEATIDTNLIFMKNNVLHGSYFNFEFRYPFRLFGSTRAKVYYARYLNESHIGLSGRELRVAGSVFDIRIDATLKSENRSFQLLLETFISNIGEGFSLSSFAIGPSVRLGRNPSGKFTFTNVMMNMRLKMGDFFDQSR
jgi:hypothetical protein